MTLAFWATVALLLAGALLFILPPLLRPARAVAGPSPLAAYRDQQAQIDADLTQGRLTDGEHAQALAELQCRVVDEVGDLDPEAAALLRSPPLATLLVVALLLPAGALALYGLIGKPAALTPNATALAAGARVASAAGSGEAPHAMSRKQMEDMVKQLAERLKKTPDDVDGWQMLARSYVAFNRLPEAALAYDRASALAPQDPQVLADYADTLAMVNGRSLEGRPMELVNAALKLDPVHQKSLALAGTAAFNRNDYGAAVVQWRKLEAVLPPGSEQARAIAVSIAQAQAAGQGAAPPPVAALAAAQTQAPMPMPTPTRAQAQAQAQPQPQPQTQMQTASPAVAAGAGVEGSVTVAATLAPRPTAADTLFVFARPASGARMPLAIIRTKAGEFPYRFKLDDSQAMSPQFKLSSQTEVMLGARISRTGNATPQSGDLMGTLGPVKLGARELKLVIDGVVP